MSDRALGVVPTPHQLTTFVVTLALGFASFLVAMTVSAPAADAAAPTLRHVASASTAASGKTHSVRVPSSVQAGDRLVMFLTWKSLAPAKRVKGWTSLEDYRGKGVRGAVWTREATAADAGRRVQVVTRRPAKGVLAVSVYRGTGAGAKVTAATARGSNRARRVHETPAIRVADPGSRLVSVWGVTVGRNPGWKPPSRTDVLAARSTPGRGKVSMLVAASSPGTRTGDAGGVKARTARPAERSAMFSVVVSPGVAEGQGHPDNSAPTAAFKFSCAKLVCDFDATGSSDPDGDALTYAWNFGDGGTSDGPARQHTYVSAGSRTVTLSVSDGTATGTATKSVTTATTSPGNADPTAAFTFSCAKLACAFDASGSGDPDGDALTYAWDFGDTRTGVGVQPQHTYASAGSRTVTMTVSDGTATATATRSVSVTRNSVPTATFEVTCADLECDFDASGSRDLDDEALTYAWEFGDGATGTGVTASHTYASAGTLTATLTVSDGTHDERVTRQVTPIVTSRPDDTDPQPVPDHGDRLVPDTAHTDMPTIEDGEIWDIAVLGDRAFIAGTFTSIADSAGNGAVVPQPGLAAYDLETGLVDLDFRPDFGGREVRAVEASPDGTRLFVGGEFNDVNGVEKRKIASLNPTTGAPLAGFTANANGQVNSIAVTDTTVYVGGRFANINGQVRVGLAALDAQTGEVDLEFDNQLSGGIGVNGALTVQQLKLTHDNARLLVVHTARRIDGQDRYGVGLIGTVSKQLLPWRTRLWEDNLQYVGGTQRIYAGDVAPDDSYFVVSSGSGGDRPPINDTAIAFSFRNGDNVKPLWISRAFDSIYSLAITENAVYIGGHFQWNESPTAPVPWPGLDDRGYGTGQGLSAYSLGDAVVRRDHLGVLNPADGTALEWHPGSNSFEGNKAMLATEHGLLTGGDGNQQGGHRTGRIAFFDFDDLPTGSDPDTRITAPIEGRVVPAGQEFVIEGTGTSTTALTAVRVEIQSGNQYLQDDLTTWGGFNTIDAELGTSTGDVTPWALPVTIADSREITLRARAVAAGGQDPVTATKKIESFSFGDLPPNTGISSPRDRLQPSTSFVLRGTATDDVGVSAVSIYFHALDTNQYLTEDGELTDSYTTFRIEPDLVGSIDTTWQHEVTLPREGEWKVGAMAVDSSGQSDTRWATRDYTVSSTGQPPAVSILEPLAVTPPVSPPALTMAPGGRVTFSGTAVDDESLATVEVSLRNRTTLENLASDGSWGTDVSSGWHRISPLNLNAASYDWSYTMPADLVPGTYTFEVRATDQQDLSVPRAMRGQLTINVAVPGDLPPNGLLDVTGTIDLQVLDLELTGTATDDFGVDRVLVSVDENETDRYLQPDGSLKATFATLEATMANPGATSTTWSLPVRLPINGDYAITVYAVDGSGQFDPSTSGATARYLVFPGDDAPFLWADLASPSEGMAFTDARIFVSGRAEDDIAIGEVDVAVINSMGLYMDGSGNFTSSERWNDAFLSSPGSVGSNYSYATPILPDGAYQVRVRPVDTHGQFPEARVVNVTVTAPAGNTAPVAAGTVACAENVCTFDARGSTDNNPAALSYDWDFGDGESDSDALITHTYAGPGQFVPTLTVTDEYGLIGTVTLAPISIVEPTANQAPTAVITPPTCVGLVCGFSGATSTDPNDDELAYSWTFGDGVGTSTSAGLAYTYAAGGSYTVTLTVSDGWGRTSTATRTVTVSP